MTTSSRTRLDFTSGGILTADDYLREQAYHLESQALRCRSLHTWGVVSGLLVSISEDGTAVRVSPGVALDGQGRQITLSMARTIDLDDQTAPALRLGISLETTLADWRTDPLGSGYGRCVDRIVFVLRADETASDDDVVTLARLMFGPGRRLRVPDLATRKQCGLEVASLDMVTPDGAMPCPVLRMDPEQTATLVVDAAKTDLFGALRVTGTVAIGPVTKTDRGTVAPRPALTVAAPRPTGGAGRIGIVGSLVFGMPPSELSGLMPGDRIDVPSDPDAVGPRSVRRYEVASISAPTVTLATPSREALTDVSYTYAKSMLFRVRSTLSKVAMRISTSGGIGIGGEAGAARLTIRDGDVKVKDAVRFAGDGSVQAGPYGSAGAALHAINFQSSGNRLEIIEAGAISFRAGGARTVSGLVLAADQNVGIGINAPAHKLVVNGVLRVSAGVIFSDGTQQNESASDLPIGTVFSLWCPNVSTIELPDMLRCCDGAVIDDPASPLHGHKAPDLRGKFVRGAAQSAEIGKTGGGAAHAHAFTVPRHMHGMDHTHALTGATSSAVGGTVEMINLEDGAKTSLADHRHDIDAVSGASNPTHTYADNPMGTSVTSGVKNEPPFMLLKKVIRIK